MDAMVLAVPMVLQVPAEREEWANRHRDHIAAEVLATDFTVSTEALSGEADHTVHDVLKGVTATVAKA